MNELAIAYKLGYNLEYYNYYLDYKNGFLDKKYLSYEFYLILSNNFDRLINGEDIFSEYILYHEDDEIKDYECFELFCKTMHLYPYDTKRLEKYRDCSNCLYFSEGMNLKTGEEEYICANGIDFDNAFGLDCHVFKEDVAKTLLRRLNNKNKFISK